MVQPEYGKRLPLAIISLAQMFRLQQSYRRFWRTRLVNMMTGSELYYYQQVFMQKPIYNTTFDELRQHFVCIHGTWHSLYQFLVYNE